MRMVRFVKVYIRLQAQIKFASAREALQRCKSRFKRKKKDLQHFAVTRKCNSCFVKLHLHADTK